MPTDPATPAEATPPMTEERLAEIHGWFDENTTICWRTNVAELLAEIDRLRAAPTGEPSADLAGLIQDVVDAVYEGAFAMGAGRGSSAVRPKIIAARAKLDRALAALQQRAERAEGDTKRLDWLEKHATQLDYSFDEGSEDRVVYVISGGVNDREWHEAGAGETLRIAIDRAALASPAAPTTNAGDERMSAFTDEQAAALGRRLTEQRSKLPITEVDIGGDL